MITNTKEGVQRQLSTEQLRAVESTAKRQIVIAGPGSGKTTVVVERIRHLVDVRGIPPARIVAITFTNAAAKELAERLDRKLADGPIRLGYVGTLHGYALRWLQRRGEALGYGSTITVLDEQQASEMLAETARRVGYKGSVEKLEKAKTALSASAVELLVLRQYAKDLRNASAVDFDTILADFLLLLGNLEPRPDDRVDDWPLVLIVDEYQDSAGMDAQIYDALPVDEMFLVGDSDQAIYSFRGGDLRNLLERAGSDEWTVHTLEHNYRCRRLICRAANNLIRHNRNRIEKETLPPALMGNGGTIVVEDAYRSDESERGGVLQDVASEISSGRNPNEIAILSRRNDVAAAFAKTAEGMGIPVRKKKVDAVPEDWRLARAALDLLIAPQSELTARQWLRIKHGAAVLEKCARAAAVAQEPLWKQIPDKITRNVQRDELAASLARLGVSGESVERINEKAKELADPTLSDIVFALARDAESNRELGDGVTITTLHSAKGREWESVYLVAFEQEIIPGGKTRDIEEERRLAFVGITRAKESLFISAAQNRRQPWGRKAFAPATVSQFIEEMRS